MLTYTDCLRASNKGKTVDVKLGKKAKIYNTAAMQKTSTDLDVVYSFVFQHN